MKKNQIETRLMGWGGSSVVECLPSMQKALSFIPSPGTSKSVSVSLVARGNSLSSTLGVFSRWDKPEMLVGSKHILKRQIPLFWRGVVALVRKACQKLSKAHLFSLSLMFIYSLGFTYLHGGLTARLCGYVVPDPVLSTSSVMLISFQSDENGTSRGFQAEVSFISRAGKKLEASALRFPALIISKGQSEQYSMGTTDALIAIASYKLPRMMNMGQ